MNEMCNTGSENKNIPCWSLIANEEYLKGLLDGYISGDGCVHKDTNRAITFSSVSEYLVDGIINIMNRFGIICTKSK